ncbi:6308_t:CDS:2 [Entrophospora sp. SA101]|nr:6308_t:CDS:2 [Entrophospora sp. SA101]
MKDKNQKSTSKSDENIFITNSSGAQTTTPSDADDISLTISYVTTTSKSITYTATLLDSKKARLF